jgi:hypothetical protein
MIVQTSQFVYLAPNLCTNAFVNREPALAGKKPLLV